MGVIVNGKVTGGNKIGRKLGFPTANVAVGDDFPLGDGVYAATVQVDGHTWDAMVNIGRKPSIGGGAGRVLEANIFDFSQDIYDRQIVVELGEFIRAERRFDSLDELRAQIEEDKKTIINLKK